MKYTLLIITLSMLLACSSSNQSHSNETSEALSQKENIPENIDIDTFDRLREKGEFEVIDVRTLEEFEQGHIPGAKVVDVKSSDFQDKIAQMDKDKEYLVYCRSGNRSSKALQIMKEAGFTNAHNVEGGYLKWSEKHKDLE